MSVTAVPRGTRPARRVGPGLFLLVTAAVGAASANGSWPGSDEHSAAGTRQPGTGGTIREQEDQRYVPIDELPEDVQGAIRAVDLLRRYFEENPQALARVMPTGARGVQRLAIRKLGVEVGYAIIKDGLVRVGSVEGTSFRRDSAGAIVPDSATGEARVGVALDDAAAGRAAPETEQRGTQSPATQPGATRTADDAASDADAPEGAGARGHTGPTTEPSAAGRVAPPAGGRADGAGEEPAAVESEAGRVPERVTRPRTRDERAHESSHAGRQEGAQRESTWLPMTRGPALMWVAVLLVLALTLRANPWLSLRNLDAVVLAAMCVLATVRGAQRSAWWAGPGRAETWLVVATAYWAVRGALLVRTRAVPFHPSNVSTGAIIVMFLFALSIAITRVAAGPVATASIDGLVGGRALLMTGELPYNRTPGYDDRSPLLYLIHAPAVKLLPPDVLTADGLVATADWPTRGLWMDEGWWESADVSAARLVNAVLVFACVFALVAVGRSLHSASLGLTLGTIFCVFPGVVESMVRPEVMIPAALIAWAVAFAALERGGGIASAACLLLAGLAWPWAWLGLLVLMGYHLRRGWEGLGFAAGLVGTAAACVALLVWLVAPTVPRAGGALRAAGLTVEFEAGLTDGTLTVDRAPRDAPPETGGWLEHLERAAWKYLIRGGATLADTGLAVSLPAGVAPNEVPLHSLRASPEARQVIESEYRKLVSRMPLIERAIVAVRTVVESIAFPGREGPAATSTGPPESEQAAAQAAMYTWSARGGVALLALIAALLLRRGDRPHQFVGGMVAVLAGGVLATGPGAMDCLTLCMPAVLTLLAASHHEAPRAALSERNPVAIRVGAAPRISVD